jgi:surfeit locus 1 family protein
MAKAGGGNKLLIAICIAGVAVLIGLGSWQVKRLFWKQELIALRQDALGAKPVSLMDIEAGIENGFNVNFLRIRAEGYYRHDLERYVYDLRDGEIGWRVVTPLVMPGQFIVFVDRGFVPDNMREPGKRPETTAVAALTPAIKAQEAANWPEPVQVTGYVRLHTDSSGWFTPANDVEANRWYSYDLAAMSASLPDDVGFLPPEGYAALLPVFIQVEPGGEPETGGTLKPVALETKLSNNHLQYATTWYALAAALAIMCVLVVRSRHSQQARETETDGQ